jgi:hypothetical protein
MAAVVMPFPFYSQFPVFFNQWLFNPYPTPNLQQ